MKLALLSVLIALPVMAQNITIGTTDAVGAVKAVSHATAHPKATYRAIKTHPYAMAIASANLFAWNAGDYLTTEWGPGQHPAQYCELVVTTNVKCQLNQPVFRGLKLFVSGFAVAQWAPVIFTPHWQYLQDYEAVIVATDGALAVPMITAVVGNVAALAKGSGSSK